jgi:hypothetical protein
MRTATGDHKGVRAAAGVFGVMTLGMLWLGTGPVGESGRWGEFGLIGTLLFAVLTAACVRQLPGHQGEGRPSSLIGTVFEVFEAAGYFLAVLLGLVWVARRALGSARLPDEMEQLGLVLLAGIGSIIAIATTIGLYRRLTRGAVRPARPSEDESRMDPAR